MNGEIKNKPTEGVSNGAAWEGLAGKIEAFEQDVKNSAPERAVQFYKNIRDVEYDFAKRNENITASGGQMSEVEFAKWEDAISDELNLAENEERKGQMNFDQIAEARQNFVAYPVDTELHKTVEARAADFYYQRYQALKEAINTTGGDEAKADLDFVERFFLVVDNHLEFRYRTPDEVRDYGSEAHERQRVRNHNAVIRHLNGMNDLANKYEVRPFTVRNFWPSDLVEKKSPAMQSVMQYDRDIVAEYYTIAFGDEVRKYGARMQRLGRFGLM